MRFEMAQGKSFKENETGNSHFLKAVKRMHIKTHKAAQNRLKLKAKRLSYSKV